MRELMRSMYVKPRVFTLVLAVSMFLAVLMPTFASAESSGIGGRPANPNSSNARTKTIFVKTIKPGETVNDAVAVMNNTGAAKTILVYSTDSVGSSGGAFACAQAVDTPASVGKWITLSKTSVDVPANTTVTVPFTISAPEDAEPGEQNGCIVLQEKKDATVQSGIALSFRTAIRVAVLIPGDITKNVDAMKLTVATKGDTVVVSPTVKNTGNVSLDVDVTSRIKSVFGAVITQHKDTFPALRGQETNWNFEFEKPFWGGFYLANYDIAYDTSDNFIGETNTTADIKTVQGPTKLFFALPSLLAGCIELFAIILIAGVIARYQIGKAHRRVVDEKWVNYTILETDQIQEIAAKFGISWKTLAKANDIKAPYSLIVGGTIKVPHVKNVTKPSKKRGPSKK